MTLDSSARSYFKRQLALITIVGVLLRVLYIVAFRRDAPFAGDEIWYHGVGTLVADGRGFLNPYILPLEVPTAGHPPLVAVVLAGIIKLGLRTHVQATLGYAVVSGASIWLAGTLGCRLFSRRVGLVAAVLAALYPYAILNDTRLSAESFNTTMVLLWVLAILWFKDQPNAKTAAVLGVVCGLGALTRPELSSLAIVAGIASFVWVRRRSGLAAGLRCAGIVTLAGTLTITPWVVRNLRSMHHPVFLTIGFGWTLANTNCDGTYYGEYFGFWDPTCMHREIAGLVFDKDESDLEIAFREQGLEYISHHKERLPVVVLARVGRTFGLYHPLKGVDWDYLLEGRERPASRAGLWAYYASIPLGLAGVVIARRRRTSLLPLVAPMAVMLPVALIAPGQVRYRNTFDAVWLLFVALAVGQLLSVARAGPDQAKNRGAID